MDLDVTVGIVAYNEEKNLPRVLEDVRRQSYPHEKMEIVLVDSMSEDGTRAVMEEFLRCSQSEFKNIQIVENPGRIQSCGWNKAIETFTTEVLIRLDAHSSIPEDFVGRNVAALEEGESVTGGVRPNIVETDSAWQRVLLTAESSMFGSSAAGFRREGKREYVKSFFHGAYRREVFERAGKFREDLGRTEDNEFHYRVRKNGFRLCMVPGIVSYQMIRPNLRNMCRQKWGNGYWVGLTAGVCPGCLSLYHFVPGAFVFAILVTAVLALFSHPVLAAVMWGMYGLAAFAMAVIAAAGEWKSGKKHIGYVLLPVLFLALHVSYGAGTLAGLVRMPFWRRSHM